MGDRLLDRAVELGGVVDLGDADAGAATGRLHEERVAQLLRTRAAGGGVLRPLAGGDHDRRHRGHAGGVERDLHESLVHADRGGEHARADVPHAGHLEQALERAVLTPRTVQEGEDDVDVTEHPGQLRRVGDDELGAGGALLQGDRRQGGVDGRQHPVGDPEAVEVAGLEDPAAVLRDADRDDVVLLPVDHVEDRSAGDAGDAVLGRTAAEDDGDTGLRGLHGVHPRAS
jgi:hypothetical protein